MLPFGIVGTDGSCTPRWFLITRKGQLAVDDVGVIAAAALVMLKPGGGFGVIAAAVVRWRRNWRLRSDQAAAAFVTRKPGGGGQERLGRVTDPLPGFPRHMETFGLGRPN